jgi:hypothetical protein
MLPETVQRSLLKKKLTVLGRNWVQERPDGDLEDCEEMGRRILER